MAIRSVDNSNSNSRLSTVVKSTAVGAATGYALKWLWPIQNQEDVVNRRAIVNYCRKITNKAKVQEFETLGVPTKAQDVFIKMIKSGVKEAFHQKSISAKIASLGGEGSVDGKEFRNIIRCVNEQSTQLIKRFGLVHKIALKYIRPSVPFLVAGAGVGFFTGFAHNVMHCDYDA